MIACLMYLMFSLTFIMAMRNVVVSFPVDTSNVIRGERPIQSNQSIYWSSFYNYDLLGEPNYGLNHATAASTEYARGTQLKVTGINSRKSVIVTINDYGPQPCLKENNYHQSGSPEKCIERQIDLSTYAYKQICSISRGLCQVRIEKL